MPDPTPTAPAPPAWTARLLDGWWIDPNISLTSHAGQFESPLGRLGYSSHVALAAVACFSAAGPVFLVELGALPLLACWILRLPFVWRGVPIVLRQPLAIASTAWLLWLIVSITWSPDRTAGWHEAGYARWMWLALAVWPVLDRRPWLIAALCAGFLSAHAAQLAEYFAVRSGGTLFSHPPAPDPLARISGWWHQPAAGGVMCAASLGLHIGPALMGTGWRRLAGIAGSLTAGLALLMTGSRGSMLAACALTAVAAGIALTRALTRTRSTDSQRARLSRRRTSLMTAVALVALAAVFWSVAGRTLSSRAALARDELTRIAQQGDANSDIGARVIAARAAVHAFAAAPIQGHGAGSFFPLVKEYAHERAVTLDEFRLQKLATAHNTPLHALATTGLVGGGLLLAAWACALWGAGRGRIGPWSWTEDLGTYSAAPLFALTALCFAAAFETLYVNNTMQGLVCLLMGLCPVIRPRPR